MKALVVEDDEISAFISRRLLEKNGRCSQVDVVRNGQEALDYLLYCKTEGGHCPNLILLDVNMPIMDASEFLDHYVRLDFIDQQKVKVVLLSTDPRKLNDSRKDCHIFTYIFKPLTIQDVEKLLCSIDDYDLTF